MAALRQTAASSLRTVALSSSALSQSAAASAGRRAFAGAAAAARPSLRNRATTPLRSLQQPALRLYSTDKAAEAGDKQGEAAEAAGADGKASEEKLKEQSQALEKREKEIAQLKDARLRLQADYENLQKITTREKAQAKDFALTAFARDLIQTIDILSIALKSVSSEKLAENDKDLVGLHTGVSMTKSEMEKVLKRHGVVAFDPTGEPFDPNVHEALYQAPVPGKEPGSVLECQEIGYMIKDRLLRPAKVGVVLDTNNN